MPEAFVTVTVADWRRAWLRGAAVRETLDGLIERLRGTQPDAVWICRVDEAALRTRVAELATLEAGCTDRAELLRRHPLFGVPFAVKDNIDVEGLPTTAACPAFARTAERSATVVRRLLDAGAVLVGKTNLDQFATGLVGTRSPYGAPASALAAGRISGGSSSGSAVAVARGSVAFALGTDTAGSGRVPAAFNQIVGLKPTPGRVSTAGVVPACRSLDCVSVFALTVGDAASVLAVIEGDDEADEYADFVPGAASWNRPLRIGVPRAPVLDAADGYPAGWDAALQRLTGLAGRAGEVVELDFGPLHEVAAMLYEGPWVAERYAVVQPLLDERPGALDPTVARVISRARDFDAVAAFRAQYRLRRAQRQLRALWRDVDLLMVPTAPRHPRFEDVAADPVGVNASLGIWTNFVNLLGWCALALPSGTTSAGLPFGVTFIAPGGADAALARWGLRWQAASAMPLGATGRTPSDDDLAETDLWPAAEPTMPIAVVGAHLSGLPLNGQLTERGATLSRRTTTAAAYRLFALPDTQPRKPGLLRVGPGGHAIEVEVWDVPVRHVGSFLALVPPPLSLGSVQLADGSTVHGFLCEPLALEGAQDVSAHGGWRAYLASLG